MTILLGGRKSLAKLTKEEQETIITFNEGSSVAEVETYSRKLKAKLSELSYQFPVSVKLLDVTSDGCARYQIDKALLSVRKPYLEEKRVLARNRYYEGLMECSN